MPLKPATMRIVMLFVGVALFATAAMGGFETNKMFVVRAAEEFQRTQKLFTADADNLTNAWQFGRACFDLADLATNETQRAEIARKGIAACQHLIAHEPMSAPGHYYLAMDFGQLAEAEAPSLSAYKLVHDIEREFTAAARLDEHCDYAGPARCLGLLYRDAPGWPISIGSKHKALEWLDRAATLAPDYPENQLNLAETHLMWHHQDEAATALKKLDAVWPVARTNLVGEAWEKSWSDWTRQRLAARVEFKKLFRRDP